MTEDGTGQVQPEEVRRRRCLVSDSFARPAFTIEQIRTFLIVAGREHITEAAKVLGLSQPAVTQQVQLLERALGVPLLERLGRGVRLSEAGEEVAAACLIVMRALENLEAMAKSIRGLEAGSLALGVTQVAGSYYLSSALAAFSAAYPGVAVDIEIYASYEICDQVLAGVLEFGLVDGPPPRSRLSSTTLAIDEVALTVHSAHPLAGAEQIAPEGLVGCSVLLWERGPLSEAMPARLIGAPFQELPQIRLASIEAARRMLLADPGFIAAIPLIAIADDIRRKTLAVVGRRPLSRPICAVRRPGRAMSPAADVFWSLLTDPQRRRAFPVSDVSGTRA